MMRLKHYPISLTSSLLMAMGIGLPAQAHMSMNGHQHSSYTVNPLSPTNTTETIQLQSNTDLPVVLPNVDTISNPKKY